MKKLLGIVLIILTTSSFARAETITCPSSYQAVYKPHPEQKDYDRYEMTISLIRPDEGATTAYDALKIIKSDDKKNPEYELTLIYACSLGSSPYCQISAKTTTGKRFLIEPQALDKDFSPTHFIARGNEWEKETAPHALIFSNSTSRFYYSARYLSPENLKYFTEVKKPIYTFPTVWLLSACKNNEQGQ